MKPRIRSSLRILALGFIGLLTAIPNWAQTNSLARAVRVSFVEGDVTVQRPDVQGWAEAPVNTPLQEGFKLATGENSFAEMQFENGGTIRLGEGALLEFTQLELDPDGAPINQVEMRQGYATFHPLPSRFGESLQVGTPYGALTAQGGTEFRLDVGDGLARVEVFDGQVEVQSDTGDMTVEKDTILVIQPGAADPMLISQGITEDDWDHWVDQRETHLQAAGAAPSPSDAEDSSGGVIYGWADLVQYGAWSSVPGIGYGWRPHFVTGGWSPFSTGQWCWYPGWGYTWIGSEPWGWLPYHFGTWQFVPGMGWVWFPGNLRTWSPGRVTWFHGPGWVGWIPGQHRKDSVITCGDHCGGGVVSTATFRRGGRLTANLMLSVNPATGERIRQPAIIPTTAVKLTGPAVSFPAAHGQSFRGNAAQSAVPASIPSSLGASGGSRRADAATPASSTHSPETQGFIAPDTVNGGNQIGPDRSWPQTRSAPRGDTGIYAAPAYAGGSSSKQGASAATGGHTEGREGGGSTGGTSHSGSAAPTGGGHSSGGGASSGGASTGGHH